MTVKRAICEYNGTIQEQNNGDTNYLRYSVRNVSTNANALIEDSINIDTAAGDRSYTLEASPDTGRRRRICKPVRANRLTINGNGKSVLGYASLVLRRKNSCIEIEYNGTEWL